MAVISSDRLQAYRARTFYSAHDLRLTSLKQAAAFVNQRGFVFFWPNKAFPFPSLWAAAAGDRPVPDAHDDPGHITWSWKDNALGKRLWYYGRVLRQRNAMLSLEALPYFYVLSKNLGDPEHDYLDQYQEGTLSAEAKTIYEALLKEGSLDTIALRKAARLYSRESDSRFNKAINLLQMDFKILPVGISPVGRWKYAFIYEPVHRHFPALVDQAGAIKERDARLYLAEKALLSTGAVPDHFLRRLFGWTPDEADAAVQSLIDSGKVQRAEFPGQTQGWIGLTDLIDLNSSLEE